MAVPASAPWTLVFLAVKFICAVIAPRGPQCGPPWSALRSAPVVCELAVGGVLLTLAMRS